MRPHIKTHKMIELAQWQIREGAVGISTAKIGEAEVMAQQGINNILIAYPIVGEGAHGKSGVSGYGYIVGHPELTIVRLSEEHGIVQIAEQSSLEVGDVIEIIPNHSCPVVNLTDEVYLVKDGMITDTWKVAARGKPS